jgi:homoserine dehydrogenase
MAHKLGLIGFGTVGQGLAEILRDKGPALREILGFEGQIVAISDMLKGALYHPAGLDVATLLEVVKRTGKLDDYPDTPGLQRGWDSFKTIRETNADTIVEVSYTDIKTGQPAIDHCRAAFESGKNVVMSNKGPVALAHAELSTLAKEKGVRWGFEGTVMSGTPSLRMALTSLVGNDIREVRGIFNGTTNYILTRMEDELDYADALREAQQLGYAEADPTADVEGYDALGKVVILANVIMNVPLTKDQVACKGISHLTEADIAQAKAEGKRWKLIARVKKEGDRVVASVGPEMVPLTDPLANIMGATNAITYECDLSGPITLVGAGAGRTETGFALLIDLINIDRGNI